MFGIGACVFISIKSDRLDIFGLGRRVCVFLGVAERASIPRGSHGVEAGRKQRPHCSGWQRDEGSTHEPPSRH